MAKFTCIQKITFYLGDFEEKYFEFQEGNEYDFAKIVDLFRLKENMDVALHEDYFFNHFMLSSHLENKGETEDSRNIIKEKHWLADDSGLKYGFPNMPLSPKLQEIYDNFQTTSRKISDLPKEIVETDPSDFDFHSQQKNNQLFKHVMDSLSDKEKLNFQSDLELDFDLEVKNTLELIKNLLLVKGIEYRRNSNPYHNFEIGSQISGEIPEKVLQGFLLKHLVSYQDMLNDIEQGKLPKIELVEEKMNDIITYYIIQKAQIINRIKKS
jgi:hypothetical protein